MYIVIVMVYMLLYYNIESRMSIHPTLYFENDEWGKIKYCGNISRNTTKIIPGDDSNLIRLIVLRRDTLNVFAFVIVEYWTSKLITVFGQIPDIVHITKDIVSGTITISRDNDASDAAIAYFIL